MRKFRVAEFFAGAGLVRRALEGTGRFSVVFANDIEAKKERLYRLNFKKSSEFRLGDVRLIRGDDVPDCDLATASFPCTDLSLAGNRKGLKGEQSGAFHEFARVIDEMRGRRPNVVLLENVVGFASSNGGKDLRRALATLNDLGYVCDVFHLDARWFSAQSRPRLFVVGVSRALKPPQLRDRGDMLRPSFLSRFLDRFKHALDLTTLPIGVPDANGGLTLAACVERLSKDDTRWWDAERLSRFEESLAALHRERVEQMKRSQRTVWATAYRRTRNGRAVWEVRPDDISGCLRTTGGGSSRQALVEACRGQLRVRWMTGREYANLQGFADFKFDPTRENEAMFALGDAVCVPVIDWIAKNCLAPVLSGSMLSDETNPKVFTAKPAAAYA